MVGRKSSAFHAGHEGLLSRSSRRGETHHPHSCEASRKIPRSGVRRARIRSFGGRQKVPSDRHPRRSRAGDRGHPRRSGVRPAGGKAAWPGLRVHRPRPPGDPHAPGADEHPLGPAGVGLSAGSFETEQVSCGAPDGRSGAFCVQPGFRQFPARTCEILHSAPLPADTISCFQENTVGGII